jgi:aconitate hydratase
MAPEYGATCGFFPVDAEGARLSQDLGPRVAARVALVEKPMPRRRACSAPPKSPDPVFTETLELDLADVVPSLAGPKRPAGRVALPTVCQPKDDDAAGQAEYKKPEDRHKRASRSKAARTSDLGHGDVVIAAITSCTNTSNPSVLIAAGLLARKAARRGSRPSRG